MKTIPPIKLLQKKFIEKFKSFDYELHQSLIPEREVNSDGLIKASCLVNEIATLVPSLVNKNTKDSLDLLEALSAAFEGWNLSRNYISLGLSEQKIYSQLKKVSTSLLKAYKADGVNLSLYEVAWLVYCSAMIREELYYEFPHELMSMSIDFDYHNPLVHVAFQIPES